MKFIGDVHSLFPQYLAILSQTEEPTIQLGDMGFGFEGVDPLPALPAKDRFIRGNHDDPVKCRAHPNYLGEFGYLEKEGIFFISGAYSIDKKWRVPGVSWWEEEELSQAQMYEALALYEKVKPEMVVSHDCPSVAALMFCNVLSDPWENSAKKFRYPSRTSQFLDQIYEVHAPRQWVFAHYHITRRCQIDHTLFVCVDELDCYVDHEPWACAVQSERVGK